LDYSAISSEQLVAVCARSEDQAAWLEFVRRFQRLIATVVVRTARQWGETSPAILDELVQDTYLKLCADRCRLLRKFEFRQPNAIYGYLKVVTTNVVHDHFKGAHAAKRGSGEAPQSIEAIGSRRVGSSLLSPSSQAGIERTILIEQIDQQLRTAVTAKDLTRSRLVFWLHYRAGMSPSAIAGIPQIGLTTKGVESMLLRLTRLVRAALSKDAISERQAKSFGMTKGFPGMESF
jgi:RNA polymerase sigma-70 factor, ECF subfamily